jgi:plastocyanin
MRRLLMPLLLGAVIGLAGASNAGAATTTVSITKAGFKPQIVGINVGDTVTWTNQDTVNHQLIADAGAFTSPVLKPGQSFSFTFTKEDGYPYRDKLNESLRGSVNANGPGDVSATQVGFQPKTVSVAAGATVTWTNRDTTGGMHQIVADDGSFSSPILKLGATYSHTFEDGGTFSYRDTLHPTFTGTVAVSAAPPVAVVLQASSSTVLEGGTVTLSGTVAGGTSGQSVTIVAQPVGMAQQTIAVSTDANGAFSVRVVPLIGTTYQALVKSTQSNTVRAQSSTVTIQVSPRVTLHRVAVGRFAVVVVDANPVAGNLVYLTRWLPTQHRWITLTSAPLRAGSTGTTFSAAFHVRLRHLRLRVYVPQAHAGAGYVAGYSNALIS